MHCDPSCNVFVCGVKECQRWGEAVGMVKYLRGSVEHCDAVAHGGEEASDTVHRDELRSFERVRGDHVGVDEGSRDLHPLQGHGGRHEHDEVLGQVQCEGVSEGCCSLKFSPCSLPCRAVWCSQGFPMCRWSSARPYGRAEKRLSPAALSKAGCYPSHTKANLTAY